MSSPSTNNGGGGNKTPLLGKLNGKKIFVKDTKNTTPHQGKVFTEARHNGIAGIGSSAITAFSDNNLNNA